MDDDVLAREMIKLVKELTTEVAQLRQDVFRATSPLFPRILGIERRLDRQEQADADWRAQHGAAHATSAQEHQDNAAGRIWGQRRNFWLLVATVSISLIAVAAALLR